MSGTGRGRVSRLCDEIVGRPKAFITRPLEGDGPCLRIDATSLEARRGGRIVPVALIVAIAMTTDGRPTHAMTATVRFRVLGRTRAHPAVPCRSCRLRHRRAGDRRRHRARAATPVRRPDRASRCAPWRHDRPVRPTS